MTIQALIIWLVIGAVAGWLAGQIMKGYGFGLIGNIVVGIVGAFIAGWLLPRIGFCPDWRNCRRNQNGILSRLLSIGAACLGQPFVFGCKPLYPRHGIAYLRALKSPGK
jgi:uncharacterized membrane protein YeaQ/YmgE (transglycosylase-associated protein family)